MSLTIMQFAAHLEATRLRMAESLTEALERMGAHVAEQSRALIGHENESWPALSESTIADKARQGYDTPSPLKRSGMLQDSISHHVDGERAIVGSTDVVAVYQELGTDRIPARSFLAKAAVDSEAEVIAIAREFGHRAIINR